MGKKDITSLRGCIEFLKETGELITVNEEINPELEIATISKGLDNGPAFLFEKVKGYPKARVVTNIFARRDRNAKIFNVDEAKKLKWKCLEAIRNPLKPRVVESAPCQEVVITKNIDIPANLPILKHTPEDGTRVMGSGHPLLSGKYFRGGTEISFKRMVFRGKDFGTLRAVPTGTHMGEAMWTYFRNEKIPVTINIGNPPAVTLIAGAGGVHTVVPYGSDELGFAGALRGRLLRLLRQKPLTPTLLPRRSG